ncbi:MAG: V-type ATP synthase subunit B, partial [Candidatus Omnitrophica bacterium]|nr:V-type ATP synthase subunit B [Candidatus Omnitrophota bacterium]
MNMYNLRQYTGLEEIAGQLFVIRNIHNVGYNEIVETIEENGNTRIGITLEVGEGYAVVQVLGGTTGLALKNCRVRFKGEPLKFGVSQQMLGRIFDGLGNPLDGLPEPVAEHEM